MNAAVVDPNKKPAPVPDATPEAIMDMVNGVAPRKPTFKERLSARFFPPNYRKWPDNIPEAKKLKGHMFTNTTICLDWKDRIRILFSGTIRSEVMTLMDMQPNKYHSVSAIEVLPPKFLVQKIW